MEYKKVNTEMMFSKDHFVITKRGKMKAQDLKEGDVIIGYGGECKITNIENCGKRPDAPIVGESEEVNSL